MKVTEAMTVDLGIKAPSDGIEMIRIPEEVMTGSPSVTIKTIANETGSGNGKEIGIVMTDGIRTGNMVHLGANNVLHLLHHEHQNHAVCTHSLAQ
jgi:hypothetical protein